MQRRGFIAIAAAVFLPLATYSINYVDQADAKQPELSNGRHICKTASLA